MWREGEGDEAVALWPRRLTHARGGRGKGGTCGGERGWGKGLRGREVGWERVRGRGIRGGWKESGMDRMGKEGRRRKMGRGKEERIWLVGRMELDEEDKDGEKRKGKRKEQREE